MVTEALSSSTKLPPFRQIEIKANDKDVKTDDSDLKPTLDNDAYDDDDGIDDDDDDDGIDDDNEEDVAPQPQPPQQQQHFQTVSLHPQQQQQQPQIGTHPSLIGKTIVASDNDVTNGFVKDGKMLPYVFEANEAGN